MSQYNNQEGSTLYDHSKTSVSNTPLTIQDDRHIEASKAHLKAYVRISDPTTSVPREDIFQDK